MESCGKESTHDNAADKQKTPPPLSEQDIDSIQKADISTGYGCLRLLLLNLAGRERLSPDEEQWLGKEIRIQTERNTHKAIQRARNPLFPDSHDPNRRLAKEVDYELHVAHLRSNVNTTRDRGFSQRLCERCHRRPGIIFFVQ